MSENDDPARAIMQGMAAVCTCVFWLLVGVEYSLIVILIYRVVSGDE